MLWQEIKKIVGTDKQLKEFAYVVGGIFIVLGMLFWWRGKDFYPWLICIGVLLLALRFIRLMWLQPLYKAWMALALCMGFVVSRIILSLLFFLVITPISWIVKLTGKRFLNTSFRGSEETYWVEKVRREEGPEYYEKQY